MTKDQFAAAAAALQAGGVIPAGHGWKTSLAGKLGVTRQTIDNFEREGTKQRQTDLAIATLPLILSTVIADTSLFVCMLLSGAFMIMSFVPYVNH